MATELGHYFGGLFNDRSVRIVVLRGAGRAFWLASTCGTAAAAAKRAPTGTVRGRARLSGASCRRVHPHAALPATDRLAGAGARLWRRLCLCARLRHSHRRRKRAHERSFHSARADVLRHGRELFSSRLVGTSIASELMLTGRFILAATGARHRFGFRVVPDDRLARRPRATSTTCCSHRRWDCG